MAANQLGARPEVATRGGSKKAPPTDEAVSKLLSKVGGTLEQALNSQELKWSSKRLDADDAHVVAYVVSFSTVLQKLVLGANSIGDAGASSIAEANSASQPYASKALRPFVALHSVCTSPLTTLHFCTSRRSRSMWFCTRLF